jgi:uncharacterized cupredoxin-like copper-binding protein
VAAPALFAQTTELSGEKSALTLPPSEATSNAVPRKPLLEIRAGDRIAFIGSAAGRALFQDGILQTLLQSGFPENPLTFLNLASAGASVSSKGPANAALEKALQTAKPDVILAFFGTVESSAGEKGLATFQKDLAALLERLRSQKSGANGPMRLVLCGPPARERAQEPASKAEAVSEASLKLYSNAMASVAKEAGVAFFDLFSASERLFSTGPQRAALLPKRWGSPQSALTVHGGFLTPEANRLLGPVLFEALLAKAPPEPPPQTTDQGGDAGKSFTRAQPDGGSSGELPFRPHENLKASLFASERDFPQLIAPVQMEWDATGRLWVLCVSPTTHSARLLILESLEGSDSADKCTIFADTLSDVASFALYRDGVLLNQGGDLWLLRDPLNSGKATEKHRLLSGLAVQKAASPRRTMVVDPKGGVLLYDEPHPEPLESGLGATLARGGAYRFEPLSGRLEVLSPQLKSDWLGSVLDPWGRDLFSVARGSWSTLWKEAPKNLTNALLITEAHSGTHEELRFWVGSADGSGAIKQLEMKAEGTAFVAGSSRDVVFGAGADFSPLALANASDGAFFFSEGNKERGRIYMAAPASAPEAPRTSAGLMRAGAGAREVSETLDLLKSPDPGTRQRARHLLAAQPSTNVLGALQAWEKGLSKNEPAYEHLRLESLWLRRWFDEAGLEASEQAMRELLRSPEPRVRAEVVRMVRETRPVLLEALALLEPLAQDSDPRVRLEVLTAASSFGTYNRSAIGLVHKALVLPMDNTLKRSARETLRRLEPDPARMLVPKEETAQRFVLGGLSTAELANAPGVVPVWLAQVDRPDSSGQIREAALVALSKARNQSRVLEILLAIGRAEAAGPKAVSLGETLADLLSKSPEAELAPAEVRIGEAAVNVKTPGVRSRLYSAWLLAARNREELWGRLQKTPERQIALLESLPRVGDARAREALHPVLKKLLQSETVGQKNLQIAALRALPLTGQAFERENMTLLAAQIIRGNLVPEAAMAMAQVSEKGLTGGTPLETGTLGTVVSALNRWLEAAPEKERGTPAFAATLQVAQTLSEHLAAETAALAKKLRDVKAPLLVVRSVYGQGRFDVQTLMAKAGESVELIFENTDQLPLNLVLLAPEAREEVLAAAAKMPADAVDAQGRQFVPAHPGVLAATRLVASGKSEVLKAKVPVKAGKYEFVSTAPGAGKGLRGVLVVTE